MLEGIISIKVKATLINFSPLYANLFTSVMSISIIKNKGNLTFSVRKNVFIVFISDKCMLVTARNFYIIQH